MAKARNAARWPVRRAGDAGMALPATAPSQKG